MNKQNAVKAFEMIVEALETLIAKVEPEFSPEMDWNEHEIAEIIEMMKTRFTEKLALWKGEKRLFATIDYFPDIEDSEEERVKFTRFFTYVNLMKLNFATIDDVAAMKGWNPDDVLFRLEELPHPIYSGAIHLWNRADFESQIVTSTLDEVITVSEAAKILGVSDRHVRRMCEQKKFACRKTKDDVWLIGRASLERYLEVLRAED